MGGSISSKSGQIISLDVIIAVGVFLVIFITFFAVVSIRGSKTDLGKEARDINERFIDIVYFEDRTLDNYEELEFSSMGCEQLKELIDTKGKEVCIYLEDDKGNVIPLNKDTKFGIGCPGINISGVPCGYSYYGEAFFLGAKPFVLKNSKGESVALFSTYGDIIIKGTCEEKTECTPSTGFVFVVKEDAPSDDIVFYIDQEGNMCTEDTSLGCHTANPDSSCPDIDNSFLLKNPLNGETVLSIDPLGKLCYTGHFEENSGKLAIIDTG